MGQNIQMIIIICIVLSTNNTDYNDDDDGFPFESHKMNIRI